MKKLDPETAQAIAELAQRPSFRRLVEAMEEQRDQYIANVAKHLTTSKDPIDQREIDRKHGFWKGVMWATQEFPRRADRDWKQWIDKTLEEDGDQE